MLLEMTRFTFSLFYLPPYVDLLVVERWIGKMFECRYLHSFPYNPAHRRQLMPVVDNAKVLRNLCLRV